jgi:hypothetical protein
VDDDGDGEGDAMSSSSLMMRPPPPTTLLGVFLLHIVVV